MPKNHSRYSCPRCLLPLIAALVVSVLSGCDKKEVDPELTASLIQPVDQVALKAAEKKPAGNRTGEELYTVLCTTCHANSVMGAPKTADAAEWAPRIEKGYDTLVNSVISGFNAMPPRAGDPTLTDDEIRRGVAYLANQAGANFTAPPVDAKTP